MTIDPNGKTKYTDIEVDPQLTFERFMRMPSNALAHTAATGIAKGVLENSPLCVFSETGCGKTHLLNAIANQYWKNYPGKRGVLTSVESMIENCR